MPRYIHSTGSTQDTKQGDTQGDTQRSTTRGNVHEKSAARIIYRGAFMRPLRLLVRMKIAQLGGAAALCWPVASFVLGDPLPAGALALSGAVVMGCGAASYALFFYGRRYVGELSLVDDGGATSAVFLRISTLSFWGARVDQLVDLKRMVPPMEGLTPPIALAYAKSSLFPLVVLDDRTYIITLRWWPHEDDAEETQTILSVLDGTHRGFDTTNKQMR